MINVKSSPTLTGLSDLTLTKMFGTNGVRGVINENLTVELVLKLSRATGSVFGPGMVAIARDSRKGGEMFTHALISGLTSTGCSVVNLGPVPVPALQYMVPRLGCIAGVMVTASHNPPQFNGIKVIGSNGIETSRETENQIEMVYQSNQFKTADWDKIGEVTHNDSAIDVYIEGIKSQLNVEKIRTKNLKVIVDCANSVGGLVTPRLLRELGCTVVSLNAQLDGSFPGRNPEPIPENLKALAAAVRVTGADLGIAHDGDADRATFVDETGRVLWGDQSFALIASRILARKRGSTLVTPVSSGRVIEDVARKAGAKIDWTEVGSVDVSHRIAEIGAELGGEENGGVFYPAHQPVRDGAMTATQVVEMIALEGKTLSQLVSELPVYFNTKVKVPVPQEKKEPLLKALLELTKDMNRITLDGVKIIHEEGWYLIRPSGTEPIYRCFAEGATQEIADRLSEEGVKLIECAKELV
ncbi:MAG: phosphoglucosamine mutase [Candidatus Thorarchaeota archaeon]|nr:phosphoglucosamine mutase [Candidatus Thorarchaeota archaeon]